MTQKNEMSARALAMEELEMVNGGKTRVKKTYKEKETWREWRNHTQWGPVG